MTDDERDRVRELALFDSTVLLDYVQELMNQQYDVGWDAGQMQLGE